MIMDVGLPEVTVYIGAIPLFRIYMLQA